MEQGSSELSFSHSIGERLRRKCSCSELLGTWVDANAATEARRVQPEAPSAHSRALVSAPSLACTVHPPSCFYHSIHTRITHSLPVQILLASSLHHQIMWHNAAPVTRCTALLHALMRSIYIATQLYVVKIRVISHVAQVPMATHSSNQKHGRIITRASNSGRRRCGLICPMTSGGGNVDHAGKKDNNRHGSILED